MKRNETQYDTKYTLLLVIVSIVTILIFFFVDSLQIQTMAFTTLALLLTLNTYEAYMAANKERYKFKLAFSILALMIFTVYSIFLFIR